MTNWFSNSFSEDIWRTKYAGIFSDLSEYFIQLAREAALSSKEKEHDFTRLLVEKKFSPGGRILAAAGRPDAKVSYMNCTTHAIQKDSLEGINDAVYSVMRASSRGQGIGIDLSKLRPSGAPVNNAALTSTGAISFMELINHAGGIIGQQGRRGALLFSLDVDHPDLWRPNELDIPCPRCADRGNIGCLYCEGKGYFPYDFLNVKKVPGRAENSNISVNVTDAFMQAVKEKRDFDLLFTGNNYLFKRTVPAQKLFAELARAAFKSAEPGVLFTDTTRKFSNSDIFGDEWKVVGVNACTEQLLDHEGVCNLGSMNLAAYVLDPFTADARFDYETFFVDVQTATEFLDNVLTLELQRGYSISAQQSRSIEYLRRIGLGVMGFADSLAMLGLEYSFNERTKAFIQKVFPTLRDAAYLKSASLAAEKGSAFAWAESLSRGDLLDQAFYASLPTVVKDSIKMLGLRNITLTSVAPTGTISNFFGVSSGIEPLFALQYTRRVRMNGKEEFLEITHPGVLQSRAAGRDDSIWQTAYEVSPKDHVLLQAEIQKFIDQSISKTTNLPRTATPTDVETVYSMAYELGLKGIAVYVDGSRDSQILYTSNSCPNCGEQGNIIGADGCKTCTVCGWSLCT